MAKKRKNIASLSNVNIDKKISTIENDSQNNDEVVFSGVEKKESEQTNVNEMVFEQHEDGSYSIKNKSGEKIYDDTVNEIKRDDSAILKNKNESNNDTQYTENQNDKKKHHFKLSRKEKEKIYEKKTFSKKMKTLAILLALGIFTGSGLGVWYFNVALRSNVDYSAINPSDYIQDVDETLKNNFNITSESDKENWVEIAKSQGKTPADLSVADNFVLAEYNVSLANSFIAIGNGNVNTLGIAQSVYSSKKYDGNKYTFESISKGKPSVAICDSYVKNSTKVSIYNGSDINSDGTNATWNYENDMTIKDYLAMVGNLPSAVQPYIISSKTIIESSDITYENGLYTFTIDLDPINSVLNYVYQVKRTGGLSALPEFKNITQTIVIDENWNLISIDVSESYSAVAFGMKFSCSGTLKTTFTYNCDVTFPV